MTSRKNIPAFDFNKHLKKDTRFEFTKLEESYNPYDASHPHRHNYFEVLYFNKSGGLHEIDFQSYDIDENTVHFVSPGQVHLLRRNPNVTGYVLSFTDDFFLEKNSGSVFIDSLPFFNSTSGLPIVKIISEKERKELLELITKIQDENTSGNTDREEVVQPLMSLFLIFCRRIYLSQNGKEESTPLRNETTRRFKKLVEKNYSENKSVSEYAQLLNITPGHLNDTVQKEVGKSASEIIHERIVLEAKRLLYHSQSSIKEIAAKLNYDDPSYFTRFFKSQTNSTPEQFRTSIREKYH